jgi:hypothetical protein
MKSTQLRFLWENAAAPARFRAGVSLHSHTMHSQEDISFLVQHAHRVPVISQAVRRQERNYHKQWGRKLDYSRVYWTPPLPPREAFDLERKQVENGLGLEALISLTDHDEIEACLQLQVLDGARHVPVSTEWTVPFGPSFVHLGVHNLPPRYSRALVAEMAEYTHRPTAQGLQDTLTALHTYPEVLVVFNHPLWDERGIGEAAHHAMVRTVLGEYGTLIHALELNALRPWPENRSVVAMARDSGHPLVSGGDRHGCEPNANVNLTNAGSFAEFVEEIRVDGMSDVLFMPQYREGRRLRYVETIWDVLRDYPEHPNRVRWSDRVFFRQDNGVDAPVSSFWKRGDPEVLQLFFSVVGLIQQPSLRPVLRLALSERQEFAQ